MRGDLCRRLRRVGGLLLCLRLCGCRLFACRCRVVLAALNLVAVRLLAFGDSSGLFLCGCPVALVVVLPFRQCRGSRVHIQGCCRVVDAPLVADGLGFLLLSGRFHRLRFYVMHPWGEGVCKARNRQEGACRAPCDGKGAAPPYETLRVTVPRQHASTGDEEYASGRRGHSQHVHRPPPPRHARQRHRACRGAPYRSALGLAVDHPPQSVSWASLGDWSAGEMPGSGVCSYAHHTHTVRQFW